MLPEGFTEQASHPDTSGAIVRDVMPTTTRWDEIKDALWPCNSEHALVCTPWGYVALIDGEVVPLAHPKFILSDPR